MDLRKEFLDRVRRGERITDLCRVYGISRKTAYKFQARYAEHGIAGLADRSRAPHVMPLRTSPELTTLIVAERVANPTWGPRKIKWVLEERLGRPLPSHTTIWTTLVKAGLTSPRPVPRRRPRPSPTLLRQAGAPNDVWCIDYKGHFRTADRAYCYPLTMTDQHCRFVLACEGMAAIADEAAREICLDVFRTHGLPRAMRSDNGAPFASAGLGGLTRLSALWLQLGIALERTRPGCPQDNGAHERMHRTLKAETTRPARANLLQQQEVFDAWRTQFNHVRPHEALGMKCPAQVYVPSTRVLPTTLPELAYPAHDDVVRVGRNGSIRIPSVGSFHITAALVGHTVGVREELDGRWLVSFADLDLGHVRRGSRGIAACQP